MPILSSRKAIITQNMKQKFVVFILFGVLSTSAKATSILASSFGWNGIDDTQALYDAFTSNVDTLYVDLQVGNWVTGPLIFDNNVNNKVIIFERNVTIQALAGAYDSSLYNGLFTFIDCNNVSLIGYGATLQMNKQEYIALNDGSEWRHVIKVSGCDNISIVGLELVDSGGDGVEISGIYNQAIPSTNIHIKDCRIDNNYRQGISVTSGQNILIEHCEITNTSGTPPSAGIDLEPDNAYDTMSNVEIKNCRITGNEGGGIILSFWQLNETTNPVSVVVSDCYIGSNLDIGIEVDVNTSGPLTGQVIFERCIIENQPANAIFSNKRESLFLEFSDIVIKNAGFDNINYDPQYNLPIAIQKQYDYSGLPLGNVHFNNVYIDDHLYDRDFMTIDFWDQGTQIENISAIFSVYNPNGVSYFIDSPSENVNITTQSIPALPLANVSISSNDDTAYETGLDNTSGFIVTRNATDASFPLGISFDVNGTAGNRLDYHYFPKALVIPAYSTGASYTITAIEDELAEPVETIDITIQPDNHYSIDNESTQLFIDDIILGINQQENTLLNLYPNPVNNSVIMKGDYKYMDVMIFNTSGQLIKAFSGIENNKIDVSFLSKGVYFLTIDSPSGKHVARFIKE